jgi:hypothetical protein
MAAEISVGGGSDDDTRHYVFMAAKLASYAAAAAISQVSVIGSGNSRPATFS